MNEAEREARGRGWVPSTWPEKATDEGTISFCIGSPRRFRDHEYVDGKCRWCPREKEARA